MKTKMHDAAGENRWIKAPSRAMASCLILVFGMIRFSGVAQADAVMEGILEERKIINERIAENNKRIAEIGKQISEVKTATREFERDQQRFAQECHTSCLTACQEQSSQSSADKKNFARFNIDPTKLSGAACVTLYERSKSNLYIALTETCAAAVRACTTVGNQVVIQALEQDKAALVKENKEVHGAELARLGRDMLDAQRACPNCAMIEAMKPRKPVFGDFLVGALQALAPTVMSGLGSYYNAKGIASITGMYSDYLNQCKEIGVPCMPPPWGGYGYGLGGGYFPGVGGGFPGMGGGFPGMGGGFPGMGGGFPGMGGGFPGMGMGFPGCGGMGGGFPGMGMGFPGCGGMGGGFPGMGMGFPGGMGGGFPGMGGGFPGMGGGLTAGFGAPVLPFGSGFNSAVFPMGPIGGGFPGVGGGFPGMGGGFPGMGGGGFYPAMFDASMQFQLQQAQMAAQYQNSLMAAQQQVMEAQQRYYYTIMSGNMGGGGLPFGLGFGNMGGNPRFF